MKHPPTILASATAIVVLAAHAASAALPSLTVRQAPANASTHEPSKTCTGENGRAFTDGKNWCRAHEVYQCNGTTGKWVNLRKKC